MLQLVDQVMSIKDVRASLGLTENKQQEQLLQCKQRTKKKVKANLTLYLLNL